MDSPAPSPATRDLCAVFRDVLAQEHVVEYGWPTIDQAFRLLTALAAEGMCLSLVDREPGDDALVERIATAMSEAWNEAWNVSPAAAVQAGESFKRRLYAETAITTLREEGWTG